MTYNDDRYPKILAIELRKHNLFAFSNLKEIENRLEIELNMLNTPIQNNEFVNRVLESIKNTIMQNYILKAKSSSHGLYSHLKYDAPEIFFNDKYSKEVIGLMVRARCGLLNIGFINSRNHDLSICNLCNLKEVEDVYHFLGRCPIFKELRFTYFHINIIVKEDLIRYLEGHNISRFSKFVKHAIMYR